MSICSFKKGDKVMEKLVEEEDVLICRYADPDDKYQDVLCADSDEFRDL